MAFFSVLIPVYNQVGKMDACFESLEGQTFTDLEIIMVDDGSADGSYEMLCGYAEKDSRIKVLRQPENSSLIGARYAGMQHATGEYVFLLDSDDSIELNTFEILHNALIKNYPDILRFGLKKVPSGEVILPARGDDLLGLLFSGEVPPSVWKNVYKRTLTDRVVAETKPFYCNMGEDVYFSTVFFTFAKTSEAIDDVLYKYQCGVGMTSSEDTSRFTFEKFRRTLNDTIVSAEHIMSFITGFAPERAGEAEAACRRMEKFVFLQHSIYEKDLKKVVEYAYEYRRLGLEEVYDDICNNSLRKIILYYAGYYQP